MFNSMVDENMALSSLSIDETKENVNENKILMRKLHLIWIIN